MTHSQQEYEDHVRRMAAASVWRVRLSEAELESCAEFEAWLAADRANATAWARVQGAWGISDELATGPELMAARRDALDRARRAGGRRWRGGRALWVCGALAATAAAVYFALAAFLLAGRQPWIRYQTGLAQRQTVMLADGTRVTLDAATTLQVRYSSAERSVRLLNGQARFEVAHNAASPFKVYAGSETILDVGTDFNVNLIGRTIEVALIKGRVTVASNDGGHTAPLALLPGQELIASPATAAYVQPVNLRTVSAWEKGQLIFDDASLQSVAAIVSRYTQHPVAVDVDAANLHISGVFKEGDVATFVDMMTHYLPVRATSAPDGRIVLRLKR